MSSAERLIPFQGRLTDGAGQLIQGVERVTFAIYDEPTGGTALWSEVHDKISIIGGQVNVLLGSISNLDDLDKDLIFNEPNDSLDFTNPRYLGITIGVETNQEMLPRHQLVPSFHARTADHASTTTLAERATIATDAELLGGLASSDYALATSTAGNLIQINQRLDNLDTLVDNTRTFIVPTGTVMPFAGDTLPIGEENDYYFCEGGWISIENVNGPVAENQALFDVIGYRYGKDVRNAGVDIYFRLPDYRGRFLRGWANGSTNDPDRASRSGFDPADGSSRPGDFVGTKQGNQLKSHAHGQKARNGGGGVLGTQVIFTGASLYSAGTTNESGGSETRPINTSVRYIIKR